MNNIFQATLTYIKRQVLCQLSQVHQHCSLLCIDKRPTEVFQPFQVSGSALHLFEQVIFQSHSVDNKKSYENDFETLFNHKPSLSNISMEQDYQKPCIREWLLPLSELLSDHSKVPLEHWVELKKISFNEHTYWKFTMENRLLVVNMLSLFIEKYLISLIYDQLFISKLIHNNV